MWGVECGLIIMFNYFFLLIMSKIFDNILKKDLAGKFREQLIIGILSDEDELDFIMNSDIKYRMGRGLDDE
jgi:hypothetical protein